MAEPKKQIVRRRNRAPRAQKNANIGDQAGNKAVALQGQERRLFGKLKGYAPQITAALTAQAARAGAVQDWTTMKDYVEIASFMGQLWGTTPLNTGISPGVLNRMEEPGQSGGGDHEMPAAPPKTMGANA